MSVILAFITAMVLILFGTRLARKPKEEVDEVLVKRYVHSGHAWARITGEGYVVVGIDDFTQSVLGSVDAVKLPRLLKHVSQGSVGWTLQHGERRLPMVSPVSGWVVEKNETVLRNPSLLNSSPYGEGWLFKVKPYKISQQLHNLLTGKYAHQWQDMVRTQLNRFLTGAPALTYYDGGIMMSNLCDRCSEQEWDAIAKEFFLIDESTLEKKQ